VAYSIISSKILFRVLVLWPVRVWPLCPYQCLCNSRCTGCKWQTCHRWQNSCSQNSGLTGYVHSTAEQGALLGCCTMLCFPCNMLSVLTSVHGYS